MGLTDLDKQRLTKGKRLAEATTVELLSDLDLLKDMVIMAESESESFGHLILPWRRDIEVIRDILASRQADPKTEEFISRQQVVFKARFEHASPEILQGLLELQRRSIDPTMPALENELEIALLRTLENLIK